MSSYSSLSPTSALPSPAPSGYQVCSEEKGLWRTRSPRSATSSSHQIRQSASIGSGCRVRYQDWEHQEALPGSSKVHNPSPRSHTPPLQHSYREDHNGGHVTTHVDDNVYSASKFRGQSDAHNEAGASRPFRFSGIPRPQTSSIQAHQTHHAGAGCNASNRRLTRLVHAQVSPASPMTTASFSPSSSPLSRSPSIPSTPSRPPSSACVVRNKSYAYISHSTSVSSLASSGLPALSLGSPFNESFTPSPSPRSQRTRSHRSTSPPPAFSIRRGFAVQRAPPTLAMSMQIHAPSPVISTRSLSPTPMPGSIGRARSRSRRAESRSRPSSPLTQSVQLPGIQRPPMPRPPSRSERLLRDTLRRAEEHDRMLTVNPMPSPKVSGGSLPGSPFLSPMGVLPLPNGAVPSSPDRSRRHSRRNTASSIATTASSEGGDRSADSHGSPVINEDRSRHDDMDENKGWSWRSPTGVPASSSSSMHGQAYGQSYHYQTTPTHSGLSRNKSLNHGNRSGDASARKHLDANAKAQMAYGTPTSPTPVRTQLQRSATSASSRRHSQSKSQSHAASHTHSHSNSRSSFDGERSACACHQPGAVVTPHEAVLRSRLEGVLRGVKEQERKERREKSSERMFKEAGSSSGSGNSMASSRNLSAEGDLFFGASGESSVTSLSSADSRLSATATSKSRAGFSSPRPTPVPLNLPQRSPHTSNAPLRSPSTPNKQLGSPNSSHNGISPLTPPPTPPFNARTAAEQCRAMDGYVSFANIEGLGVPEGEEDDDEGEDGKGRGRWWQWLTITSGKSRGRSDSASSALSG